MKKIWVEPRILVQEFVANEYVAACGDKNKVYKFECNAPAGPLYYYPKKDDKVDGIYTGNGRAQLLGNSYHPCSAKHEAKATDDFYDGFVDYNRNRKQDEGEGVIVWRGPHNNNGHATKVLDMDSWETTKS